MKTNITLITVIYKKQFSVRLLLIAPNQWVALLGAILNLECKMNATYNM
jgi:hypothetical protein